MISLALIFLITFLIAFFASQAGVSGGFIILPILVSLGYVSPCVNATNYLYNVLAAPSGVYRYWREGRFAKHLFLVIISGIIPGIAVGVRLRTTLLINPAAFKAFVGAILLVLAIRIIRAKRHKVSVGRIEGKFSLKELNIFFSGENYKVPTLRLFGTSFLVGIISGAYGIGGGALMAPILVSFFSLPIYVTAAATLSTTYTASIFGLSYYTLSGYPPILPLGVVIGIAGFLGIYIGARIQRKVPERRIRLILAAFAIVLAIKLFYSAISYIFL